MIELGDKVKCTVTGFTGTATARHEYLNGCVQYSVRPPVDKEGKLVDVQCFDVEQLVVVSKPKVAPKKFAKGGEIKREPKRF